MCLSFSRMGAVNDPSFPVSVGDSVTPRVEAESVACITNIAEFQKNKHWLKKSQYVNVETSL